MGCAANTLVLYPATVIATDTTTAGVGKGLHYHARDLILVHTVSARTDGTFTVTLQHSKDGTNWTSVLALDGSTAFATAAVSSNTIVYKYLVSTVPFMQYVRASILSSATTTGATNKVELIHGVTR